MSRKGRVVGAALGLLLLAAPIGIGSVRAQTAEFTPPAECSDPPPAEQENGITINVASPTGSDPRTSPEVLIDLDLSNTSTRPVVGGRNGVIDRVRATVLACEVQQVLPEAMPDMTPGTPDASYTETVTFPTNGRFAIVIEAIGTSTNPSGDQDARAVVPVQLAVPPKKPTNVEVSDPANGVVTVTWDYVEPEPDLFGFEVRRARQGSGEYTTVKNGAVGPKVRSVSDTPPAGAWRYQVIAYRQGAPEGAVSRDGTVEVAEAAPAAAASGDTPTTAATGGGGTTGTGTGTGTPSTIAGSAPGSSSTSGASVDLSKFAAALNARRTTPTLRVEPPDPGFQETLPFEAPAAGDLEEEPEELGADEANVGLGQRVVADPGERQRSLGFVAFGLLLFVLSMTGLFLKSEVRRADLLEPEDVDDEVEALDEVELEGVDLIAVADADAEADAVVAPPVVAAVAARLPRRRRHAAAPEPLPAQPQPSPAATVPATPVVPAASAERLPRRRRTVATDAPAVAEPHLPATAAPAPPIAIPDTRRRWSRRPNGTTNGHAASPETHHHFDDLAEEPTVARANGARRRTRLPELPLDAPGLDVPDPAPPLGTRSRKRASAHR